MGAIKRFWARSVLNKITLLMSFSLVFCCCGWTGRIGGGQPTEGLGAMPQISQVTERAARSGAR